MRTVTFLFFRFRVLTMLSRPSPFRLDEHFVIVDALAFIMTLLVE
jgi:hypothetical protein